MRKSIVYKWFLLLAFIFSTVLLFIGIAQNYFFEKYYINEKLNTLKTYMDTYSDLAAKKDRKRHRPIFIRITTSG
ncbi:hypothetical protein CAFE_14860 [Caprobacter fermentans]|uniref:Two-component sensor histidine kinase n=1 Tax=Caproicibacter fermentans TaxID=2576756 RepID=A0A6N8HYN4_9FIRM|nr:hypothetical protein [Caproicibacter fermentans]